MVCFKVNTFSLQMLHYEIAVKAGGSFTFDRSVVSSVSIVLIRKLTRTFIKDFLGYWCADNLRDYINSVWRSLRKLKYFSIILQYWYFIMQRHNLFYKYNKQSYRLSENVNLAKSTFIICLH